MHGSVVWNSFPDDLHAQQDYESFRQGLKTWGTIYKISYDYLTIMPKLRSTYDGRLIYKTSYEGRKAFLRYDSLAIS